jgi:hypothetical protein
MQGCDQEDARLRPGAVRVAEAGVARGRAVAMESLGESRLESRGESRAPVKRKREGEILRAVRDYLRVEGWLVIRNQQGLGSYKGLPDLTAIRGGEVW